jgi:hypothetical protein
LLSAATRISICSVFENFIFYFQSPSISSIIKKAEKKEIPKLTLKKKEANEAWEIAKELSGPSKQPNQD